MGIGYGAASAKQRVNSARKLLPGHFLYHDTSYSSTGDTDFNRSRSISRSIRKDVKDVIPQTCTDNKCKSGSDSANDNTTMYPPPTITRHFSKPSLHSLRTPINKIVKCDDGRKLFKNREDGESLPSFAAWLSSNRRLGSDSEDFVKALFVEKHSGKLDQLFRKSLAL